MGKVINNIYLMKIENFDKVDLKFTNFTLLKRRTFALFCKFYHRILSYSHFFISLFPNSYSLNICSHHNLQRLFINLLNFYSQPSLSFWNFLHLPKIALLKTMLQFSSYSYHKLALCVLGFKLCSQGCIASLNISKY